MTVIHSSLETVTVLPEATHISYGVIRLVHGEKLSIMVDTVEQEKSRTQDLYIDTKKTGSFLGMVKSGYSVILLASETLWSKSLEEFISIQITGLIGCI
jgi:hypothetical protein